MAGASRSMVWIGLQGVPGQEYSAPVRPRVRSGDPARRPRRPAPVDHPGRGSTRPAPRTCADGSPRSRPLRHVRGAAARPSGRDSRWDPRAARRPRCAPGPRAGPGRRALVVPSSSSRALSVFIACSGSLLAVARSLAGFRRDPGAEAPQPDPGGPRALRPQRDAECDHRDERRQRERISQEEHQPGRAGDREPLRSEDVVGSRAPQVGRIAIVPLELILGSRVEPIPR